MDFVADPTSSPVFSRNSPAKVAAVTAAMCLVVALVANSAGSEADSAGSPGQAAHQQPSTQREDPGRYLPLLVKRGTYVVYLACRDPRTPWYAKVFAGGVVLPSGGAYVSCAMT